MAEKKMSWADMADEDDAEADRLAKTPKWVPPHARQVIDTSKQKLKNLFSKEKARK